MKIRGGGMVRKEDMIYPATSSFPDGSAEQDIQWLRLNGLTDAEIANHLLRNTLKIDITVEQIGNIVFNESRSLYGDGIEIARENIAHAIINGNERWGDRVNIYAQPASPIVNDEAKKMDSEQYNDSQTAAINAVMKHSAGVDPTSGAEHFNFRINDSRSNFLKTCYIVTQVGPLDNSWPSPELPAAHGIYGNTYKDG